MNTHPLRALALASGLALLSAPASHAQVSFGIEGYQQTFTPAGTWTNATGFNAWTDNSTLPGWYATNVGGVSGYYRATNANGASPTSGTGNPGGVSVIAARSVNTDGALGSVSTSTHHGVFGVSFVNTTGETITSLTVSYVGEQWAWNSGGLNTLAFAYSLDASSLATGTWTGSSALSFTALYSGGTNVGLDGNSNTIFNSGTSTYVAKTEVQAGGTGASNNTSISATITGLSIASGETFWFRWTDTWAGTGTQVSQALAIDNLSVTATTVIPEPASAALLLGLFGLAAHVGRRSRRRDSR